MGDLRAAVARALSGLDMFSSPAAAASSAEGAIHGNHTNGNGNGNGSGNGNGNGSGLVMDAAAVAEAQVCGRLGTSLRAKDCVCMNASVCACVQPWWRRRCVVSSAPPCAVIVRGCVCTCSRQCGCVNVKYALLHAVACEQVVNTYVCVLAGNICMLAQLHARAHTCVHACAAGLLSLGD